MEINVLAFTTELLVMEINVLAFTTELLVGVIGLASGLAVGFAMHRFARRRLVDEHVNRLRLLEEEHVNRLRLLEEEHENQLALLKLELLAQEQHRKEDKEDLERSKRAEDLTSGKNDPEALKRTLEMQRKIRVGPFANKLATEDSGVFVRKATSLRTRLLLFGLLIVMVGLVAAVILILR